MRLIKKSKKQIKYFYSLLGLMMFIGFILWGYRRFKISYSIAVESQFYFKQAKSFFYDYGFTGCVVDRKCIGGDECMYFLIVKLDTDANLPNWGESFYYNYYVFDLDINTIEFMVSKQIYDNAIQGVNIKKELDSIIVNNDSFLLISKDESRWLP